VLPSVSSHEDSFLQRLDVAVELKERLAEEALKLIEPGAAVFSDSSTTGSIAARRIVRENRKCTLLTSSVPFMQLVCAVDAPSAAAAQVLDEVGGERAEREWPVGGTGPGDARGIIAKGLPRQPPSGGGSSGWPVRDRRNAWSTIRGAGGS
jgi:hypothetical protein